MWASLLAALVLSAPYQAPKPGVIQGEVRSERTGEPVPFAVVEVAGSLVPLVASADSLGRYQLRGIPAGRQLLRARGIDHSALEIELLVPSGREVRVDFTLRLQPVALPGLVVEGQHQERAGEGGSGSGVVEPELGRAVVRTLEATPGMAELGLVELGRAVRPGQEPADPSDVLYVRGAPADLKLVLLDGAPVYAPFHAGGLLQAFEPALVRRADLYLGGAPARYDGGLSYVLDLETRRGEQARFESSGAVDLLTARTVLEGPLGGGASALVSARSVHGQGAAWILGKGFPYGYGDALGRIDVPLGRDRTLGVTGFWNREAVNLDGDQAPPGREAVWGNRAAALRYRGALLGREAELTVSSGAYRALLPLNDSWRTVADGSSHQTRVVAAFSGGAEPFRFSYGITFERLSLEQRARTGTRIGYGDTGEGAGGETNRAPGTTSSLAVASSGTAGGTYFDVNWSPATRVLVRGGLRADLFSTESSVLFAPRVAVTWALSERAVLLLAGGRYRQFVRGSAEFMADSADIPVGITASGALRLAGASHLLVSLDQLVTDGVRFGIEGYYKRFEGVPSETSVGDANASGVDLWLRRGQGRITGWVGYSLGWVWTPPTKSGAATELFSGRHLLSLGVSGEVGAGGQLGLKLGYGAGLPYSALPNLPNGEMIGGVAYDRAVVLQSARDLVVDAPPVATPPDQPYLRLDAEFSFPWETTWGGAEVTIMPYLKVYNALDRRDAFFYRTDGGPGSPRPLAALPILPVLGVQWRF